MIKERPRSKLEAKKTSSQTSYQQKQHLRQAKRQSNMSVMNDTSNGATASQALLNNQDLLKLPHKFKSLEFIINTIEDRYAAVFDSKHSTLRKHW